MQPGQSASPGSSTVSKSKAHTTPRNPGAPGTGKGKDRAQSRGYSHASLFPPISSVSSSATTYSAVASERFASPPTPTPSHAGGNSPRPRSPPVMPAGAGESRSVQRSAGTSVRGGATPQQFNWRSRGVGLYARQVVAAHGYPFGIFPTIASIQADLAPEDWYNALQERIDCSTPELISALVDAMRKDLGLLSLSE